MDPHILASIHVLKAGFMHQRAFDRIMKPFDISHEQFNVLKILEESHPDKLTLKEIQDRLLNKTGNATRLVEKLRKKGWLKREISKESRREVSISITQKGLDKITELKKPLGEIDKDLKGSLNKKEAVELTRLLKKFMP